MAMRKKIQNTGISNLAISSYVNQATHELIGNNLYFANGYTKFISIEQPLDLGTMCNPLVDVKQVGKWRDSIT